MQSPASWRIRPGQIIMEKRAIVFVVMTMFTLVVFQYLQPQPQVQRQVETSATNSTASKAQPAAVQTAPDETQKVPSTLTSITQQPTQSTEERGKVAAETLVTVDTLLYKAVFSTRGGMLKS